MLAAIENPHVDCIGHPTGRKINRRAPYEIDFEAVVARAAETGTFLEINCQPDRLDLKDTHARLAAEAGVGIVVSSDAHRLASSRTSSSASRRRGRAWLTRDQVVNTRPWPRFEADARKR